MERNRRMVDPGLESAITLFEEAKSGAGIGVLFRDPTYSRGAPPPTDQDPDYRASTIFRLRDHFISYCTDHGLRPIIIQHFSDETRYDLTLLLPNHHHAVKYARTAEEAFPEFLFVNVAGSYPTRHVHLIQRLKRDQD